jgi:predicted RNA-binding Zn-ribbon protein involved in translation (DUF1610 family)
MDDINEKDLIFTRCIVCGQADFTINKSIFSDLSEREGTVFICPHCGRKTRITYVHSTIEVSEAK